MKTIQKTFCIIGVLVFVLCPKSMAIRLPYTWENLQTSDFIVLAKVTKIEEIGEGRYESTYTVLRTYKGEAPKNLKIQWTPSRGFSMQRKYSCSISDMSAEFILFAEREEDGFTMTEERFMRKPPNAKRSANAISTPINLQYIRGLPQELREKVTIEKSNSGYVQGYLEWNTIKDWLENEYP